MVLEAHMKLCVTERDFAKKKKKKKSPKYWESRPNIGKVDQKWAKKSFLNLLKHLVINFTEFVP